MDKKIIITDDGSHTISIPGMNVTYHSIHGAIRESMHVFIEAGLHVIPDLGKNPIRIFEMGFGTGLNALLTLAETQRLNGKCEYETIELFPLEYDEINSLNYVEQLQRRDLQPAFEKLHTCAWEEKVMITPYFSFRKSRTSLLNDETPGTCLGGRQAFELIYFDAFDPNIQPELWTKDVFDKMFSMLKPGGILVTYSSKGEVRRALQAAGFNAEKLPGPPRKREMIRATHPEFI